MELPHEKKVIEWFPDDTFLSRRIQNNATFNEPKESKNFSSNCFNYSQIDPFSSIALRESLRPEENSIHSPSGQQINNINGQASTTLPPPPDFLFGRPEAPNFQRSIDEEIFAAGIAYQTLQRNHMNNTFTPFKPEVKVGKTFLLPIVNSGQETIAINLDYEAESIPELTLPQFSFNIKPSTHMNDFAKADLNFF